MFFFEDKYLTCEQVTQFGQLPQQLVYNTNQVTYIDPVSHHVSMVNQIIEDL